ncbi:MAG: CRISPR-associated protein Cas4 [Gorillibacterium sp.]|nr:CRISPR-associated protein Cas4 [Gorillibacterium sp.]
MNFYTEDELLSLSGIQHYSFCPRQWALIHVEQQWEENVLTYEGTQMHRRADDPFISETRGDVLITRALPLVSYMLGIYGVADVVEFHAVIDPLEKNKIKLPRHRGWWVPFPVEYKRGKPKADDWDEVQLCAQALALEEMLNVRVEEGALFYGERERRVQVKLTAGLRERVDSLLADMHMLFDQGKTPRAKFAARCNNCSLVDMCLPKMKVDDSANYLEDYLANNSD